MNQRRASVGVALVAAVAAGRGAGQPTGLDVLTRPPTGTSARVSSNNPDPNSNGDNRWVKPGETFTVAELKGPGVIRHLWFTFAEPGPSWIAKDGAADHSQIVLRMYWDGGTEPAVEAPFGDFFAAGFGRRAELVSLPMVVQGGDSYNCFWPMPFHESARITLTNESDKPLAALYYQVDFVRDPGLSKDTMYFCAQYRQEFPARLGEDYLIADIAGKGKYVGTVMSVRSRSPEWFGEGDEKFYVDGAVTPTLVGTGTEDYFLNAWGMEKGCFPYYGVTQLDGWLGDLGNKGTMYRWHIADPVEFQKSLRMTIEHAGWMSADETSTGKVEGFVEREDDFATVAYWYQQGQPKRFAKLPSASDRRLPSIDRVIEGKALLGTSKATDAELSLQAGAPWTGDGQVFIAGQRRGAAVEFVVQVPSDAGPHRPVLAYTKSFDYGVYRVSIDGKVVEPDIDGYAKLIEMQEVTLGQEPLVAGEHVLRVECVGKNDASSGFKFGVDSVRLRERTGAKRPPMSGRKP